MKKTPVLSVTAIKGGTGKTATAGALAFAGHYLGKKILCVDMDPQANLTMWIGGDPSLPGVYSVLTKRTDINDAIQHPDCGLDILASSADSSTLKTSSGSAMRLFTAIEPIKKNYNLIIIDTGPSISETLNNAICASTEMIIPIEADTNSLQGLYQLIDVAGNVNPSVIISGVLITKYDRRPNVNKYMRETIADVAKDNGIPYLGEIHQGIAIREAMVTGEDLYEYAPKSKPAQDYMAIYHKLFERK